MHSNSLHEETYLNFRSCDDEGIPINRIYTLSPPKFFMSLKGNLLGPVQSMSKNRPQQEHTMQPEEEGHLRKKASNSLIDNMGKPTLGKILLHLAGTVHAESGGGDNLQRNIHSPSKFESQRVKNFMNYLEHSMMLQKKYRTEFDRLDEQLINTADFEENNEKMQHAKLKKKRTKPILKMKTKYGGNKTSRERSAEARTGRKIKFSTHNTVYIYQR